MAESTNDAAATGPKAESAKPQAGSTKRRDVRRERITAALVLTVAFLASVAISWKSGQKVQDDVEMRDE